MIKYLYYSLLLCAFISQGTSEKPIKTVQNENSFFSNAKKYFENAKGYFIAGVAPALSLWHSFSLASALIKIPPELKECSTLLASNQDLIGKDAAYTVSYTLTKQTAQLYLVRALLSLAGFAGLHNVDPLHMSPFLMFLTLGHAGLNAVSSLEALNFSSPFPLGFARVSEYTAWSPLPLPTQVLNAVLFASATLTLYQSVNKIFQVIKEIKNKYVSAQEASIPSTTSQT